MDLDALTAELLSQPLDQFTSRRNTRVKEVKASGEGDLANQLSALKKPSLPLWAANQVRNQGVLGELRSGAQALLARARRTYPKAFLVSLSPAGGP